MRSIPIRSRVLLSARDTRLNYAAADFFFLATESLIVKALSCAGRSRVADAVNHREGATTMNRIRFGVLLWLVLVVAIPLVAEAHHASVMFDSTKEITLEGT